MTELSCLVLNCTLKKSPAESSSELLGSQVLAALRLDGGISETDDAGRRRTRL